MNEWVIYKIVSPTGKTYIGSAKNFKKRINRYKCLDCKKQTKLYRSFIKHGFESHVIEIIMQSNQTDLFRHERQIGDKFDVLGSNGLNIVLPGFNDIPAIYSDEFKERVSRRVSGVNNPMYGKAGFAGKRHNRESMAILSKDRMGNKNPMYGISSFESPNHIICLHTEYGLYLTLKEASEMSGWSIPYMSEMINNKKFNKTKFIKS